MKKILLILIVSIIFVCTGCNKPKEQVIEEKNENIEMLREETNKFKNADEEVPEITKDDLKIIREAIKKCTTGTELEGLENEDIHADFFIGRYSNGNVNLKIYIEKPISELEMYWKENSTAVIARLENFFAFDVVKTEIKNKLSYNDYTFISVEYTQDGEMYTMQGIRNN